MNHNKIIAILASWSFEEFRDSYYCPTTHLLYLNEISKIYKNVYVITPCLDTVEKPNGKDKLELDNVNVIKLPHIKSYLDAQKFKKAYTSAIIEADQKVDLFYCRVPDPFCWLPSVLSSKPYIMHFVGDIIDATKHNTKWSWLRKKITILGFYPELYRIYKASRNTEHVFTNGFHIYSKLKKSKITSVPVISSTIKQSECVREINNNSSDELKIIYVGYLRYAKGVNTIMKLLLLLKENNVNFTFDIVGDGEMFQELQLFIKDNELTNNVCLHGHIDDRSKLMNLLKTKDLFFFPSLSEGSPRVVIEAISQGLLVLSTPVGSLPYSFVEKKDILFFPFNRPDKAFEEILYIQKNINDILNIRRRALSKVINNFTINKFIKTVFTIDHEA